MHDLMNSREDLAEGWARMEAQLRDSGLDSDLVAWSEVRIRQLLGVSMDCPFDPPEDSVANFVELFFMDVHSITDEQADAASAVLGDALFVALVVSLGITEARARMEMMLT